MVVFCSNVCVLPTLSLDVEIDYYQVKMFCFNAHQLWEDKEAKAKLNKINARVSQCVYLSVYSCK